MGVGVSGTRWCEEQLILKDALVSAGALAVLLATLVALDERVRGHAMRVAGGLVSGEIDGAQLHETAAAILAGARAQTAAHVPLTIFAAVAAVLVLCMTRMSWR